MGGADAGRGKFWLPLLTWLLLLSPAAPPSRWIFAVFDGVCKLNFIWDNNNDAMIDLIRESAEGRNP